MARQVLSSCKRVYGEKPLALTVDAGSVLIELAAKVDRRIGSAPDTVLLSQSAVINPWGAHGVADFAPLTQGSRRRRSSTATDSDG